MPQFLASQLLKILAQLPPTRRYRVAYSGGRDSHVLLHVMVSLRGDTDCDLSAIHVNHGLNTDAGRWASHCQEVCNQLSVPLDILQVDGRPCRGESPEAAARHARYQAFSHLMEKDDCLLTAHHIDDQAETLLLQLLRGSGPHGLAGMPAFVQFSQGIHARPLLSFRRSELGAYADKHGLEWIEDPSNHDTSFRRNFIRQNVFPALVSQWPAAAETLSRSASHCADAAILLDNLAVSDLQQVQGAQPHLLSIKPLIALDDARQRNVIRYWIKSLGFPLPRQAHLERLQQDVLYAGQDRMPLVCWQDVEIRRYRNTIYVISPLMPFDHTAVLPWDLQTSLQLPGDLGVLEVRKTEGTGIKASALTQGNISVRFRQGGEAYRPSGNGHAISLKKLFQKQGVPPWQRDRIPLIYIGDQLVAVAGICVCEAFTATAGIPSIVTRHVPSGAGQVGATTEAP